MPKKLTYEEVKKVFEDRGFILLETEYVNNRTKMRYLCEIHGVQTIKWNHFKDGHGCYECGREASGNKQRLSFDKVSNEFHKCGYKLLSDSYVNSDSPLDYICPSHGVRSMSYGNLMAGKRCSACSGERISGENHPQWKGGITELHHHLRMAVTNSGWVKDIMELSKFTCCITGEKNKGNLNVHHTYSFSDILLETLNELQFPIHKTIGEYGDNLILITNRFIDNNRLRANPVVLTDSVHTLFHRVYGYGNNTPQQFHEFKARYDSGEFTKQLNTPA